MSMTSSGLKNPPAVAVGVALVVLFGVFAITNLPVQLLPDIDRPLMTIETEWRAASPIEVESEIMEPQEDVLRGLPGLREMRGSAGEGSAYITMEFVLGTDMQETLLDVISRLNRVPPLPADAEPPIVDVGPGSRSGNLDKALSWFYLRLDGNPNPIETFIPLVDDIIRPRIEAVPGVASVAFQQNQRDELHITFDPYRAADLGIDIGNVARQVGRATDVTGGFIDVGRRQYTVRFEGRYHPEDLEDLILDWRQGKPVYLRDIAEVARGRSERRAFTYFTGQPALSFRVDRQPDANLLEALNAVKAEIAVINEELLKDQQLEIVQSFDASVFIYRALGLVSNNLMLGALLAVGILWWFLRRLRATLIIALTIPCSLAGTFIFLFLADRSFNVISLAGLAFATGMVLDAAIVVLENIVRIRGQGASPESAAEQGATQVWGALLASTATTVAIFLPIIFVQDVEGQLFADLALTIAVAVVISLVVATVVVPTAASRFLPRDAMEDLHEELWAKIAARITWLTDAPARRWMLIGLLMVVPVTITVVLLPDTDYLPPVKRDSVDAFYNIPAGYNVDHVDREVAQVWIDRLEPYRTGEKEPKLLNYFIELFGPFGGMFGVRLEDVSRIDEMQQILTQEISAGIPDLQAFFRRGNLLGNFDGGRYIALHLQARDSSALLEGAREIETILLRELPGAQIRAQPSLQLAQPELTLRPRDRELVEAGWTRTAFGPVVRALGDGLFVGEYFDGDDRLDIILRAEPWSSPEEFATLPLATPTGRIFQVGQLVDLERSVGPSEIYRFNGRRTITMGITVPDEVPLQAYIERVRSLEPQFDALLPGDGSVLYGGSASELEAAIRTMAGNFGLALLILFMLMAALFRSMKDSLLVILSIPLATFGSVLLLRLINTMGVFQPLDLLTMIGFVILLGLVVNNAILLVHQTRAAERAGMDRRSAVEQALRIRTRPILMSTLTSIFGMLPLLLMPGEGSVIYRGLAAAIVGGMAVSTAFTMVLLPCLLRLGAEPAPVEAESLAVAD